jgi:hypothetical protein
MPFPAYSNYKEGDWLYACRLIPFVYVHENTPEEIAKVVSRRGKLPKS